MSARNIKPFLWNVSDKDLNRTLQLVRDSAPDIAAFTSKTLTEVEPQDTFQYGLQPERLKSLVDYFANEYDFRVQEKAFNDMGEQGILTVATDDETFDVHFVHAKSDKPDAIPLLFSHGWPGSVLEIKNVLPLLTSGSCGQAFHVVAPSIPGYAFSSAPKKKILSLKSVATCFNSVMLALGYNRYVAQGGDWGSIICRAVAFYNKDSCKAIHLNFFMHPSKEMVQPKNEVSEVEQRGIDRGTEFREYGSAYSSMQGTTPYTLGAALTMHPVSLLAYMAEKLYRWSAPDSQPSHDEVITNMLIYWFSKSITSSFWLYYNRMHGGDIFSLAQEKISTRCALSFGSYEIHWNCKEIIQQSLVNTASINYLSTGGHFLALERPEALAKEMANFFGLEDVQKLF